MADTLRAYNDFSGMLTRITNIPEVVSAGAATVKAVAQTRAILHELQDFARTYTNGAFFDMLKEKGELEEFSDVVERMLNKLAAKARLLESAMKILWFSFLFRVFLRPLFFKDP
ncbi:MAG: hypothetical protein AB1798_05125 [Spirochaetota bacterium]